MQRARLVLRRPRENRVAIVRQYVGRNYSEEGTSKEVPLNLIGAYCKIVGQKLISDDPRVMLSTWNRQAKAAVKAMEAWCNEEIKRINLANTLKRVVFDALFSLGICKVGICDPGTAAALGWGIRAGEPYAQRVDLDDFVFDIHARDFDECSFMGHRYRVPLRVIRESKIYSKDRKTLQASDDRLFNMEGDERVSMIGRTYLSAGDSMEFEDMVDLWEVYLPRHRLILTLRDDQLGGAAETGGYDPTYGKALRIQKWLGPEKGPYHLLGLGGVVPGNPMPKGPLQDLIDLHLPINRQLRKLIREADNFKEVAVYSGGAGEDAKRIEQTSDGEWARVDNPDKVGIKAWGGPNQNIFQIFSAMKELFSWLSGNLDIMGGLGPQSHTATQDELLAQNSSATVSEMQGDVVKLTASVLGALCWYWHHSPMQVMRVTHSIPGLGGIQATTSLNPPGQPGFARNHSFEDMDIQVDPYSLSGQTPQARIAALNTLVTQVITPLMPMLQQQGINFDVNQYLELWARYNNQPDVEDILTLTGQPVQQPQGRPQMPESPTMPAQTTRNYNRRSTGGATPGGTLMEIGNQMQPSMNGNGRR